jgi:4-hydroxybenzoate polyprenyltransferase
MSDIKIMHSLFALPFAAIACLVAIQGITWQRLVAILFCMVAARSFAMGVNRLLDYDIDGAVERTMHRPLASGDASVWWYLLFVSVSGLLFVLTTLFFLSPSAQLLSPIVLIGLAVYGLFKRFTWFAHFYLGFCLAMAPIAVVIALGQPLTHTVVALSMGVLFWTAGFDIIYSLQDRTDDLALGLHSVPVRFGKKGALLISNLCYLVCLGCFAVVALGPYGGTYTLIAVVPIALLLAGSGWESRKSAKAAGNLVQEGQELSQEFSIEQLQEMGLRPDATEKSQKSISMNKAFFSWNVMIGFILFVGMLLDYLL